MGWSLAIDLGTTNTVAAVRTGTAAPVELELSATQSSLPSQVFLSASSVYVGDAALEHAAEDPASFYPSPKRLLMQTPESQLGTLRPVFGALYREVYRRALGQYGPGTPDRVVLTHPEALSGPSRQLLRDAAAEAGMPDLVLDLVSEPVAAAAHYYRDVDVPERLLIVDIGGGTCDTALLRFDSSGAPVLLSSMGDNGLGGRTFDHRLVLAVAEMVDGGTPDPETVTELGGPLVRPRIQQARELLSTELQCSVELGDLPGLEGTAPVVTRSAFEQTVTPELDQVRRLVEQTLSAGHSGDGAVQVCLTGGTALTPAVQDAVAGAGRLRPVDSPFTAVSLGALLVDPPSTGAGAEKSVDGVPSEPVPSPTRRRWVTVAAAVICTAVVAVGGGLFLGNRGGDDAASQDSPDTAGDRIEDTFDPSPVPQTVLADDSPVLASGDLDCAGITETVDTVLTSEFQMFGRPTTTGRNGITQCIFGYGKDLVDDGSISVNTYRPNNFRAFQTAQRSSYYGVLTPAGDDLPGWYALRQDSDDDPTDQVFLYIRGHGWLVVETSGNELRDAGTADSIARAVTPTLKVVA